MAISGSMSIRTCTSNSPRMSPGRRWRRAVGPALLSLALAFGMGALAACQPAPVLDFGRPAPVGDISTLQMGESTPDQVRAVLGAPRGDGVVRHSKDHEPRTIWYYEYGQFKQEQVALKIVLVFFKGDRYDGHLWFSSKELVDVAWK